MKTTPKILPSLLVLGLFGGWAQGRAADGKTTPPDDAGTYSFPGKPPDDAEGQAPRGGRAGADTQKAMMDKLNLTPDQQKKIAEIRKKYAPQLVAARGNRPQMADLMKKQRDEIRALLTPDQRKLFDQMPVPGRGGAGRGAGAIKGTGAKGAAKKI